MFTLTLAQAKNSQWPRRLNMAPCDPEFVQLLNEAQQRLADAGRWWGTYQQLRILAHHHCITWPRFVATVEAINLCGQGIAVRNQWFEYRENVHVPVTGCRNVNNNGNGFNGNGLVGCSQTYDLDRNTVCQFRNLDFYQPIRIYVTSTTDVGKKVILQGNDQNGQPWRTPINGVYGYGEQVTLASPFVTSGFSFAPPLLTGVQKDVTDANLLVYSVDPTSGDETLIAIWEPSETSPSYRRNVLTQRPRPGQGNLNGNGNGCRANGNGCEPRLSNTCDPVVDAMVRLEFIPALVDTDWLFISRLDAIGHMMMAIRKENANQYQEAAVESALAIKILRQQLEKYNPPEREIMNVETYGTAPVNRVLGGFV